jgi:SAM-dependent methyltransferase
MEHDRRAALAANEDAYDLRTDAEYVKGAPHLRHRSIRSIHHGMFEQIVTSIGKATRDLRVLELGAGSGLASTVWMEAQAGITAVDASRANLDRFVARARRYGASVEAIHDDIGSFVQSCQDRYDVVSHVSVLHHIPDYLALVRNSQRLAAPGGSLITLEDPLRYDRISRLNRFAYQGAYFSWRVFRGNYRQGLKTRWRRIRGVYDPSEAADYEEYHVVRNGIDSDAVEDQLRPYFSTVQVVAYWSTFAPPFQHLGHHLGLRSHFGALALNRVW